MTSVESRTNSPAIIPRIRRGHGAVCPASTGEGGKWPGARPSAAGRSDAGMDSSYTFLLRGAVRTGGSLREFGHFVGPEPHLVAKLVGGESTFVHVADDVADRAAQPVGYRFDIELVEVLVVENNSCVWFVIAHLAIIGRRSAGLRRQRGFFAGRGRRRPGLCRSGATRCPRRQGFRSRRGCPLPAG